MESKAMMEQKEYPGPIVVDARVSIASGGLHSYVGIEPIDIDLDSDTDGLVLYQEGEMIVGYYPRFWRGTPVLGNTGGRGLETPTRAACSLAV
jgi:hypothetical protein